MILFLPSLTSKAIPDTVGRGSKKNTLRVRYISLSTFCFPYIRPLTFCKLVWIFFSSILFPPCPAYLDYRGLCTIENIFTISNSSFQHLLLLVSSGWISILHHAQHCGVHDLFLEYCCVLASLFFLFFSMEYSSGAWSESKFNIQYAAY
jgi:hypothetical protein